MHSCTTCSGALAPAVMRTVSTSWNQECWISETPSIKCDGIPSPWAISARRRLLELFWLPKDEHQIGLGCQFADGLLAILRRVADVVFGRVGDVGEFLSECGNHHVGVVNAQGCLGKIGDLVGIADDELFDVFWGLDQDHLVGGLTHGADDLIVALVADQDDRVSLASVADGLEVDLDHERAGGVDGDKLASAGLVADLGETPCAL